MLTLEVRAQAILPKKQKLIHRQKFAADRLLISPKRLLSELSFAFISIKHQT